METRYKYLIVGGGMTADAATKGIRRADADGSIGMLCDEPDAPYDRPPLSKSLWKNKPLESIHRKTADRGVKLLLDRHAVVLTPTDHRVTDDRGDTYVYEKLLLATGGRPRRLSQDDGRTLYYRTLQDYRRLRELTDTERHFIVIGGGFIGSEVAAALALNGKSVTLVLPGAGICSHLFPRELALFLNRYYEEHGVTVITGVKAVGVSKRNGKAEVLLENGVALEAAAVVAGLGIDPNVELAQHAGLATDNGIVVDEFLRTAHPDISAAGDVASFHNPLLNMRLRVEHEDNANAMGEAAGLAMAGEPVPYHYLPYFYSDLFELGYEAIGDTNPRLEVRAFWVEPFRKGILLFLREQHVRGIVFWNVWDRLPAGRELLARPEPSENAWLADWAKHVCGA